MEWSDWHWIRMLAHSWKTPQITGRDQGEAKPQDGHQVRIADQQCQYGACRKLDRGQADHGIIAVSSSGVP